MLKFCARPHDDPHEKLNSTQKIEVQDFYVMRFLKKRDFRLSGKKERRNPPKSKVPWPHLWFRNNVFRPGGLLDRR